MNKGKHFESIKKHPYLIFGITILLLLLWVPTSIHKLIDFESFKNDIYRQPISLSLSNLIIYSLPIIELLTAFLIVTPKYRLFGFIASTFLMTVFTLYIASALLNVWDRLPCGCGNYSTFKLARTPLVQHSIFNLKHYSLVFTNYSHHKEWFLTHSFIKT